MISNRAFAIAVIALLGLTWLVLQLDPRKHIDPQTRSRWQQVQQINTCLLNGAELLERRYAEYRDLVASSTQHDAYRHFFAGFGMGSGEIVPGNDAPPSPCYRWLGAGTPEGLQALARNYVTAYDQLRPDAEAVERWLAQRPMDRDPLELARLEQALSARLQEARTRAIPLRQAFEQPQLEARQQQLASIEQRLGHDQHWYTLRFMIDARQTMDALDAMTTGAALTPRQLLDLHQSLMTRWADAETFIQALPRLRSADGNLPVWSVISSQAWEWLTYLERLQQHWAAGADAAQLNQDLAAARAGYDELQRRYNAVVVRQY
ncbi:MULTISPECIES: DUF3829 domain-containing protein [unclassified Pseudomonas]|jgi:hypothetical protein|uniref:DUF3829 domain-containing protein n=1 Tax=unclassified Pseudomonas TaxID=196821 RepID=UPI000908DF4C|nr:MULTISPECIES: DUF3829 domain-containing protein [unclassified Pseudomonas]ROO36212.1 hypothetical protein BIV08_23785 [Pseudomonas sp. AF76]ROO40355.1 hypothetical protein BIV09_09675 [Pseudomonas sp. 7SR1]SFW75361.1 Protein of unknown function [Pseudomonas sp. NFACC09-4]SFX81411.1 Protein of unknown function [Pseudomonas sp. NFACC47-1]SFY04745.1 Protein of unknown function [Pseudomonas sp. NFACC36]